MVKIYIAGKYTSKERLRLMRDELVRRGFFSTAHWLDTTYPEDVDDEVRRKEAMQDWHDVIASDRLILDTLDESNTGGRETELGMAISNYIPAIRIGPVRQVFHLLCTQSYEDWDSWLATL